MNDSHFQLFATSLHSSNRLTKLDPPLLDDRVKTTNEIFLDPDKRFQEIEGFGGKINGTQKMDRKRFERMTGDLDSGFYVNVQFSLAPDKVEPLRVKLSLNEVVYRQFYLKQETVAA